MKDLDRNVVYFLENIKKDEAKFNQLKDWLKKNVKDWTNETLSEIENHKYIYYSDLLKDWNYSNFECNSICALTLFEEDFVPNTVIEVSKSGKAWDKRVLLMLKNDKAICWLGSETIEESKGETGTTAWKYYRNIPTKTILTKQQIADKFGLDINLIEIENE